ncbi:MAG: histidinol dehydrogenase [Verrucomicrobiaceae bacterium]|nr:histidinol dehydrogenase [Verrucomicrobiaceae bacterium]
METPINLVHLSSLDAAARNRMLKRAETDISKAIEVAQRLISEVRASGDKAVSEHLRTIDKVEIAPGKFKVTTAEIDAACASLDPKIKAAVDHSIRNVRNFHQSQLPEQITWHEVEPGVMAGEKVSPVDSIGLYVPRGKGAFPSVMIMLAVPAVVAGVKKIAVCTPPNPDGSIDTATLYAARQIGVEEIYRIGGATAIAAFALGTESVPKVAKILGPGNQYCSAAKRLLSSDVDVGLPAGPSESIILADGHADPKLIATDLMIEAEHGPDSAALLVTDSEELAHAVRKLLPDMIEALPEPRRTFCKTGFSSYGGIVVTRSLEESVAFVNDHAPEHMELQVQEPFAVLPSIVNAGEVLIGPFTPISAGNYCIGVNAILPTGGFAKSHSCTSVHSFLKRMSLAYCTRKGFEALKETTAILADYEGFPAHANAVKNRPI